MFNSLHQLVVYCFYVAIQCLANLLELVVELFDLRKSLASPLRKFQSFCPSTFNTLAR